jgi:hypothetical protein
MAENIVLPKPYTALPSANITDTDGTFSGLKMALTPASFEFEAILFT